MDGEVHSEASANVPGEDFAESGWTTTKQAAKVLGVSRRSVQGYVRRGLLEAKVEGEGVNKRFIVSIASLNAFSERRRNEARTDEAFAEASAKEENAANLAANTGEPLRHAIDRLEARTEEATELRVRLQLSETAESTLREELTEERRRREAAEREREELRRQLEAFRETPEPYDADEEQQGRGEPHSATAGAHEDVRRPWWRRVLGR
jgi:acetyl/propionyl-CoA carboxylase alpha subunit